MTPVDGLHAALAAVDEAWAAAVPPFGPIPPGDPSALIGELSDPGLLALLRAVGAVTQRADAFHALLAAELAARSPAGRRAGNLARTAGHTTPGRLVAATRGGHVGRAVELVAVGQATSTRRTETGEALPPAHPHVAAALHAGTLSVDAAHLLITALDRLPAGVDPAALAATETDLVRQATHLPLPLLGRAVKHALAALHPAGLVAHETNLRAARTLTLREDPTGMLHLRGAFDPESAAPIRTALTAYTTARLRDTRGHNHPDNAEAGTAADDGGGGGGPGVVETRTIAQLQADALTDFARHLLGCDTTTPLIPAVTMVVRVDLPDLEDRAGGRGYATLDGIDQPIPAATARKMACTAGLLPAVFDGPSLPLDLGRSSRTFTKAQVLALWERDGGCACCGQTTFVEAHHIRWWSRDHGPTDLTNAVLLCSSCHHTIHHDGWAIHVHPTTTEITFTPPTHHHPAQPPRPAAPNPRRHPPPSTTPAALTRPAGEPRPTRPPTTTTRPPDRDNTCDRPPPRPTPPTRTNRTVTSTGRPPTATNRPPTITPPQRE